MGVGSAQGLAQAGDGPGPEVPGILAPSSVVQGDGEICLSDQVVRMVLTQPVTDENNGLAQQRLSRPGVA